MHTKITKRVLEGTLTPATGELFLRDTELRGFGVRITPKGSITFFAEGRLRRSRNKRISLGRYPVVSLENAREKAREALYKLNLGIDPLEHMHQIHRDALKKGAAEALKDFRKKGADRANRAFADSCRSGRINSGPSGRPGLSR